MPTILVNMSPRTTARRLRMSFRQRPVLFVGAGISHASGLPLQNELKATLLKHLCASTPALLRLYKRRQQLWVPKTREVMLEVMLDHFSRASPTFARGIANIFLAGEPTHYHTQIATLLAEGLISGVITTNFDNLIERAFLEHSDTASLPVIVRPQDRGLYSREGPFLFKIHGCATKPSTMMLTLARVGKGLEPWKVGLLRRAACRPFIFIGYSDRDKDIFPILTTLANRWLWLFYNGESRSSHIPQQSTLRVAFLRNRQRLGIYTDPMRALGDTQDNGSSYARIEASTWKPAVAAQVDSIPKLQRILALADMLRTSLAFPDDAAVVYTHILRMRSLALPERLLAIIQRNAVYGNSWRQHLIPKHLSRAVWLARGRRIPGFIRGAILKQYGDYYQQAARQHLDRALKSFEHARRIYLRARIPVRVALVAHNKAVTYHRSGDIRDSIILYDRAIRVFSDRGEVAFLVEALINKGSALLSLGQTERSLAILGEALEKSEMLGNDHWIARCWTNMAEYYQLKRNRRAAKKWATRALAVLRRMKDKQWQRKASGILNRQRL